MHDGHHRTAIGASAKGLQYILPHHDVFARFIDQAQGAKIDGGDEAFKEGSY
jgi:hypothetical protein